MVRALFDAAVQNGRREGIILEQFAAEIDDWCLTGWPRWWPKPGGPQPVDLSSVFAGATLAATVLAESFEHNKEAAEAFHVAADRLGEQLGR